MRAYLRQHDGHFLARKWLNALECCLPWGGLGKGHQHFLAPGLARRPLVGRLGNLQLSW